MLGKILALKRPPFASTMPLFLSHLKHHIRLPGKTSSFLIRVPRQATVVPYLKVLEAEPVEIAGKRS
jgi:hypothetical protein